MFAESATTVLHMYITCTEYCVYVGDLTHAKYSGERYSKQFEEEWKVYGDVLRETRAIERQPWLDIRGNHGQLDITIHHHLGILL